MPFNFPALFGICLAVISVSAFAQDQTGAVVKYRNCLNEARAKEKAEIVHCAGLQSEAAVSACTSRYSVGEATIAFCKLKSGIILTGQPNNTVDEGKAAAERQSAHERSLGLDDSDDKLNEMVANQFAVKPVEATNPEDTSGKAPKSTGRADSKKSAVGNTTKSTDEASKTSTPKSSNAEKSASASNSPSPNATTSTSDPSAAQAQASADLARCESAQSAATRCCNNPLSCASSSEQSSMRRLGTLANSGDVQGLAAACRAMESSSDSGGDINTSLGAICTNNHYACTNTCSGLVTKYESLMAGNENSEISSIYSSTLSSLRSRSQLCSRLSARADALSSQGLSSASNSGYGNYCQQLASAAPSAASSAAMMNPGNVMNPNDVYGCAANPDSPACVNCSRHPNSPACLKAAADARGEAGFRTNVSAASGGLNVQDISGEPANAPIQPASGNALAMTYPTVPNNAGAGVPGAQGGPQAQLDSGVRPRGGMAPQNARGYTTEVDQGYRSDGYSQPVSENNTFPMHYGQRPLPAAPKDETTGLEGMDLKQFLPGGSRDPGRRLAGAAEQIQINAKEENIWRRISNKMYEKCRLGILWRCNN